MTPTTTSTTTNDLSSLFIFDDFEAEEQQSFLEEVGTLIFQSALMLHLSSINDMEAERFERFIENYIDTETFIDVLCLEFPQFEKVLTAQMRAFNADVKS